MMTRWRRGSLIKKRGYMFAQEGKGKDKHRKEDPKVIGEALVIGKDELIMKKID